MQCFSLSFSLSLSLKTMMMAAMHVSLLPHITIPTFISWDTIPFKWKIVAWIGRQIYGSGKDKS